MKKFLSLMLAMLSVLFLASCATSGRGMPVAYDLGPLQPGSAVLAGAPAFLLQEPVAPEWLDGTKMHYRLAYANSQQTHAYAHSRWSMAPAKLIEQRLKARIVQGGGVVLKAGNGVPDGMLLKLELEDFSQRFDAADRSAGQIVLRVSALKGRALLGQKTFLRMVPADSPDAAGGAKALAQASDDLINDVLVWLARLSANG